MYSLRRTKDGRLVMYYTRKGYKKARWRSVEARAERWYRRTFGEEEK